MKTFAAWTLGIRRNVGWFVSTVLLTPSFVAAAPATVPMSDCVRLALERSPTVRASAFQVDAFGDRVAAARAAYVPTLLAHAEYGRAEGYDEAVTNGGSTQAVLRAEATLLDGGLRNAELEAARARMRAAAAVALEERADVALAVRTTYLTALAARTDAATQAGAAETLESYTSLLVRQERLGAAPENDVLRARLSVAAAETARRAAESDLDTSRAELARLTGIDIPAESLAPPEEPKFRELSDAAIDAAPVVVDARSAAEAAERDADAIRSEHWGRVTVTGDAGAVGVRPQTTFDRDGGGQFLLGFDLPLFDGGNRTSRLAAAVAEAKAARVKVDAARQTIQIALSRLRIAADRRRRDLLAARAALPLAEKHFELMRARHVGGGNVRLLEVLDALAQTIDLRLGASRADLTLRLAVAEEDRILGETAP